MVITVSTLCAGNTPYTWGGSGDEVAFFDAASGQIEKDLSQKKYASLKPLYAELFYAPIWVKAGGLSPFGVSLLNVLDDDKTVTESLSLYTEGHAVGTQIAKLAARGGGSLSDKVSLELSMSRLYRNYARYRLYGGIDWQAFQQKLKALTQAYRIKVGWVTYHPDATPGSVLNDAVNDGNLKRAFAAADPKRFGYAALRSHLIRYIAIARKGGWKPLPHFATIKPRGSNPAVIPLIRKRLAITGDLQGCKVAMDSPKYDACLMKAVQKFQVRHGLNGEGIIGGQTRATLNTPVTQIIQKLRLNLDRIKWLYRKESAMRIELNIPAFRLNFLDGKKLVTTIRVITGRPNHPTPSFHNTMSYIVVNPYWKIPEGIVKSEMIPKLLQDPYHYEAQGKELHESWDENSPRVDPGTVDWSQYQGKGKHIPYYFMQVPGRHNALGKIKFLFPNGYSVYIHDTPSKNLFFKNVRAFSHGCMRIQKPRELLESLALFNDNIHVDAVMQQLKGTEKKTIALKKKVPLDITYLTAYIDPYGYLNFRKDVYHYDQYQLKNYVPKVVSLIGKTREEFYKGASKRRVKSVVRTKVKQRNKVSKTLPQTEDKQRTEAVTVKKTPVVSQHDTSAAEAHHKHEKKASVDAPTPEADHSEERAGSETAAPTPESSTPPSSSPAETATPIEAPQTLPLPTAGTESGKAGTHPPRVDSDGYEIREVY